MQYINPFKPTAGKMPPVLVGRDEIINDFIEGIEFGSGAPGRLMRITGPRGSGKTVILSELGSIAKDQGWLVVDASGTTGIVDSIARKLKKSKTVRGVNIKAAVPFASVELQSQMTPAEDFETLFEESAERLTSEGKGLLVTIDEVQDASEEEMRRIATAVQFLIRDDMNIALVFAGITTGVMDLLNGKAMTFLRRAKPEELQAIPLDEVKASLAQTIERSGLQVEDVALEKATQATEGYAYLIQLVGYHVWRAAWLRCRDSQVAIAISEADADQGIASATQEFYDAVLETAIAGLPKASIDFALAMSERDGVVSVADVAKKLEKSTGYLSPYRRRLISRQVIEQTAPGYVTFSIPFMGQFLRERRSQILARYGE